MRKKEERVFQNNKKNKIDSKPSFSINLQKDIESLTDQEFALFVVKQYLYFKNYKSTLQKLIQQNQNKHIIKEKQVINSMVEFFSNGKRQQFFEQFNKLIYKQSKMREKDIYQFQFYLHIYFFIYQIHPALNNNNKKKISKASVKAFREYIQKKGKQLFNMNETKQILQYSALLYIQNPIDNNKFKHLFTSQWIQKIRQKLHIFINSIHQNKIWIQKLIFNFKNQDKNNDQYVSNVEQINRQLMNNITISQKNYKNVMENYRQFVQGAKFNLRQCQNKWFSIVKQLVTISNNVSKDNKLIQITHTLKNNQQLQNNKQLAQIEKKIRQYQTFVNTNIDDLLTQNMDFSLFQKPSHSNQIYSDFQIQKITNQPLNFKKIKKVLLTGPLNQKMLLLDAIKHRVISTSGMFNKRLIIITIQYYDFLGIKNDDMLYQQLMKKQTKDITLRLLISIAQDYYGREYMSCNEKLIKDLMRIFSDEQQIIRRNCLICLQKLTLRKKPSMIMIQNNFIEILINEINKEKEITQYYQLQYLTALLMNLSLMNQGKKKFVLICNKILNFINKFIEHQSSYVRTHINGMFYSLLELKIFRENAKALGMDQNIRLLRQKDQGYQYQQLTYLLNKMEQQEDKKQIHQQQEENDSDQIQDQPIGQQDDLNNTFLLEAQITGQQLIQKQYLDNNSEAYEHLQFLKQKTQQTLNKRQVLAKSQTSYSRIRNSANISRLTRIRANKSSINNSNYQVSSNTQQQKSQKLLQKNQKNNNNRELNTREKKRPIHVPKMSNQDIQPIIQKQKTLDVIQNQRKLSKQNEIIIDKNNKKVENIKKQELPLINIKPQSKQNNTSNSQNRVPTNLPVLKQYQKNKEYKQAFQTRNKIIRTPPNDLKQ